MQFVFLLDGEYFAHKEHWVLGTYPVLGTYSNPNFNSLFFLKHKLLHGEQDELPVHTDV